MAKSFADRDIFARFAGIGVGHLALEVAGPVPALVVDMDKDEEDHMQDTDISEDNEDHGDPGPEDWNEDKDEDEEDEESESGASDDEGCETDDNEDDEYYI